VRRSRNQGAHAFPPPRFPPPPIRHPHLPHPHWMQLMQPEDRTTGPAQSGQTRIRLVLVESGTLGGGDGRSQDGMSAPASARVRCYLPEYNPKIEAVNSADSQAATPP